MDEDQFETVLIYYTNDVSQRISNPVDGHQMFFTLDKVQKYLPALFSEWLKLYNKHKNIFSLYFDTIWHTSLPRETEFNSIVQALEGYHRTEIRGKRLFPKSYFRSLIRNMRTKCTHPDEKKIIKKIQQYVNEPSLKQRIRDITDKFPYIFKSQKSQKTFIQKTIGARTYLTHREPDLIHTSVNDDELYYLIQNLHIIFIALLILELPISDTDQKRLIQKYSRMRKRFKLVNFS